MLKSVIYIVNLYNEIFNLCLNLCFKIMAAMFVDMPLVNRDGAATHLHQLFENFIHKITL